MKIDIDLSEIFEDEDGRFVRPDVKDLIVSSAVSRIVGNIPDAVKQQIREQVNATILSEIKTQISATLESIIPAFLDQEIKEVGSYGETGKTFTVRNRIAEAIKSQMIFKDERYASERNKFTSIIFDCVEKMLKEFQPKIIAEVNTKYAKEVIELAEANLRVKLGIK